MESARSAGIYQGLGPFCQVLDSVSLRALAVASANGHSKVIHTVKQGRCIFQGHSNRHALIDREQGSFRVAAEMLGLSDSDRAAGHGRTSPALRAASMR